MDQFGEVLVILLDFFHLSASYTKEFPVKPMAGIKPQLKGCETYLKSLIIDQIDPLQNCHKIFLLNKMKCNQTYFTKILNFIV